MAKVNKEALKDDFLVRANSLLKLPDDAIKAFTDAFNIILGSDILLALINDFHMMLFHGYVRSLSENRAEDFAKRPEIKSIMGKHAGMFSAVVLITGLPHLINFYKDRNISDNVVRDTLGNLLLWMEDYRSKYGMWGLESISWLMIHFTGNLYQIGRLQYSPAFFTGDVKVFMNIHDRKVLAVSLPGIHYRKDRQRDGCGKVYDHTGAWESQLYIKKDIITGHPVDNSGSVGKDMTDLALGEWQLVLSKGDVVLDVHIPAGEKLKEELCRQSLVKAKEFYCSCFPEVDYKAFSCVSWLLSPPLSEILSENSNIVRFQKMFYLYPNLDDGTEVFKRIYGYVPDGSSSVPRDTSLRRAVSDYVSAGGHVWEGAGFIMKDDVETR